MKKFAHKLTSVLLVGTLLCGLAITASAEVIQKEVRSLDLGYTVYVIPGLTEITKLPVDRASLKNSTELNGDYSWLFDGADEDNMCSVYSVPTNTTISLAGLYSYGCADLHLKNGLLSYVDNSGVSLKTALKTSTTLVSKQLGDAELQVFDENSSVTFLQDGYYAFSAIPYPEALDKDSAMGRATSILKVGTGESGSSTNTNTPPTTNRLTQPSSAKVTVDGKVVDLDAYNIDDNNYFKLRDIASILNGSTKQFDVSWDAAKNAINLLSNKAYTAVGGELKKSATDQIYSAIPSTSTIYKDNTPIQLTAYNIQNNNHFKLRSLGEAFGFSVNWDAVNNTIVIDTTEGYTPE